MLAAILQRYGERPNYRAMLGREGVSGPEDIAIIGDESEARERAIDFLSAL